MDSVEGNLAISTNISKTYSFPPNSHISRELFYRYIYTGERLFYVLFFFYAELYVAAKGENNPNVY